jgi:hypothetical protein
MGYRWDDAEVDLCCLLGGTALGNAVGELVSDGKYGTVGALIGVGLGIAAIYSRYRNRSGPNVEPGDLERELGQ